MGIPTTWCLKSLEVGDHVATIDASMMLPFLIATRYPIFRILQPTWQGSMFSRRLTLPVAAADVPKTAIITPFGLFEFLRMPFGLKNSAQAFQRLMDTVCQGLDCAFVYIDDILVASKNVKEHKVHLRQLFQRLQDHDLVVNVAKCCFSLNKIDFLGHLITQHGITPSPSKVDAVRQFKQPSTVKGLQEFVGMVNFYHRFIPDAAKIMMPLFAALSGKPKTLVWSEDMIKSFQDTKSALARAAMLTHPRHNVPISLTVDASDHAVGAVLQQLVHGTWQPLGFFSQPRRSTVPLIGSCWACTYISDTSWRAGTSLPTRTTSPSHSAWPRSLTLGPNDSSTISLTFQSIP